MRGARSRPSSGTDAPGTGRSRIITKGASHHGNRPNTAAGRTRTAPRRDAEGRAGGARPLPPRAGNRAPATGLANKPDRSRPASDYAGNRAAPRPLFRRLGGDLVAPSGGL